MIGLLVMSGFSYSYPCCSNKVVDWKSLLVATLRWLTTERKRKSDIMEPDLKKSIILNRLGRF